jgi:transcriptional regulator
MPDSQLYVPRFNVMDHDEVRPFVGAIATAQLVTVGDDGVPDATFLPVLWEGDRLVGHLARANPHWRRIVAGSPALAVVTGPDTYVSPSWYASKAEHGKVVPTWNYVTVQAHGTITTIHDPDWLIPHVGRLVARHEAARPDPWALSDAPDDYVRTQARAIVGLELRITRLEAKSKLRQNRSEADIEGAIEGLATGTPMERAVAEAMRSEPGR